MTQFAESLRPRVPRFNHPLATTRKDLVRDLGAGILLSVFLVPVGMAYAQASGLPPISGLYATVVPMVVYGLVGPSRLLVLGPDSSLAPLIAATVLPLAASSPQSATTMAAALAIGTGLISLAAGLGGLGLLTELLSLPIRRGYLIGVAVVVGAGQLPLLLGIEAEGGTLNTVWDVIVTIVQGGLGLGTAAVGLASLIGLIVVGRLKSNLYAVAITVAVAIMATRLFGLPDDLAVVGSLPRGAPSLTVPSIARSDLGPLAIGAISVALVSFADTSVLSQSYASREARHVDPNRELATLGLANLACGFFQGFPVSGSSSRTPVLESAGARSQTAGLVAAATVLALIGTAPDALSTLPLATLAAVLIVSVSRLIGWDDARRLRQARPSEFALSMICAAGVVVAGPLWGIGLAVAMSILVFLLRSWRPHTTVLVRVDGLKGYHDFDRHPEGRQVPGLLLYRFDAPLFFANAEVFRKDLSDRVNQAGPGLKRVIITAEPITDIDATADHTLLAICDELQSQGIELGFAELKGVVRDQLQRSGTVKTIGPDNFHPTVGRAVQDYVEAHDIDWVDWEDTE
ncbi:MAG: SulP family inorganic anion transporter [Actinomycetia bacterium]|nr:SulP family inorganic anion transporter [Actinomycetes bacterium]